jgi:hypothetical protein
MECEKNLNIDKEVTIGKKFGVQRVPERNP